MGATTAAAAHPESNGIAAADPALVE
jgi:hypothetical protein